jgi:hypothetical protein
MWTSGTRHCRRGGRLQLPRNDDDAARLQASCRLHAVLWVTVQRLQPVRSGGHMLVDVDVDKRDQALQVPVPAAAAS